MPPATAYNHITRATIPVKWSKNHQEDLQVNIWTTLTSRQQALQEVHEQKIVHPRRQWFCTRADRHIFLEHRTTISTYGHLSLNVGWGPIQGEPSMYLTYIVSLLRGAAFEWYSSFETRIGCPGHWATLYQAMLEQFGSLIRAIKVCVALLQLMRDKMTVLQ